MQGVVNFSRSGPMDPDVQRAELILVEQGLSPPAKSSQKILLT